MQLNMQSKSFLFLSMTVLSLNLMQSTPVLADSKVDAKPKIEAVQKDDKQANKNNKSGKELPRDIDTEKTKDDTAKIKNNAQTDQKADNSNQKPDKDNKPANNKITTNNIADKNKSNNNKDNENKGNLPIKSNANRQKQTQSVINKTANNKQSEKTANSDASKTKNSLKKHKIADKLDPIYLAKPGYTNSLASKKIKQQKPIIIRRSFNPNSKIANSNSSNNEKPKQTTKKDNDASNMHIRRDKVQKSLIPTIPPKTMSVHHRNAERPMSLKSATLGISACIIFLIALAGGENRY